MGYYSFNRPRRDGRLSWPCWLTDSRRFTHKVVKRPSISLAQDRESSPARTDVLTTRPYATPPTALLILPLLHVSERVYACLCVFAEWTGVRDMLWTSTRGTNLIRRSWTAWVRGCVIARSASAITLAWRTSTTRGYHMLDYIISGIID